MSSENEFMSRDDMGLQPEDKTTHKSEAAARTFYFKLFSQVLILGPAIAFGTYIVASYLLGQAKVYDRKFSFMHEYSIGWLFLAWYVVYLTRIYLTINANGARAEARLDRPDQHVYQIMAEKGPLANAPYVLMKNTGPIGRFNRAQRAVFNMDETMTLNVSALLLASSVFGPIPVGLALVQMYGRIKFADGYTNSVKTRGGPFRMTIIAEHITAGLVVLCGLKSITYPFFPI